MKNLLIATLIFLPHFANASGIMTIKGKLISMDSKEYVVQTKTNTIYIDKAALTTEQTAVITHTEIPVSLQVPFEAVLKVKRNKAANVAHNAVK